MLLRIPQSCSPWERKNFFRLSDSQARPTASRQPSPIMAAVGIKEIHFATGNRNKLLEASRSFQQVQDHAISGFNGDNKLHVQGSLSYIDALLD